MFRLNTSIGRGMSASALILGMIVIDPGLACAENTGDASSGVMKLQLSDGKEDKMLKATGALQQRLRAVKQSPNGNTPTLKEAEAEAAKKKNAVSGRK